MYSNRHPHPGSKVTLYSYMAMLLALAYKNTRPAPDTKYTDSSNKYLFEALYIQREFKINLLKIPFAKPFVKHAYMLLSNSQANQ